MDGPQTTQHRSLTYLPTEVLQMVVHWVSTYREYSPLRAASDHLHETLSPGHHPRASLAALSEVSRLLAELCAPSLWEEVNLGKRNNADYLYFLHTILPRHGRHVHALEGIDLDFSGHVGRAQVPKYLAEALGISSRLGYASESNTQMDTRLLGSVLILPPAESGVETPRDWVIAADQTANLLTMIVSSPHLSALNKLDFYMDTPSDFISRVFASLRMGIVAGQVRLTSLIIRHHHADEALGAELKVSNEALAGLLESCPYLTYVALNLTWVEQQEGWTEPVIDVLRKMDKLEGLTLQWPLIDQSWVSGSWAPKLQMLELRDVTGSQADLLAFISQFASTLVDLNIDFSPQPSSDPPSLHLDSDLNFPLLSELHLASDIPADFVDYFRHSPLRYFGAYHDSVRNGGSVSMESWRRVFKQHGATLQEIEGTNSPLSAIELHELAQEAKVATKGVATFGVIRPIDYAAHRE